MSRPEMSIGDDTSLTEGKFFVSVQPTANFPYSIQLVWLSEPRPPKQVEACGRPHTGMTWFLSLSLRAISSCVREGQF